MMKRVLQISKYYYPFLGGTEQVARDMTKAIQRMGGQSRKLYALMRMHLMKHMSVKKSRLFMMRLTEWK